MKLLVYLGYCNKGEVYVGPVIQTVSATVFHRSLSSKKQHCLNSEYSNTNILLLLGLINDFHASF